MPKARPASLPQRLILLALAGLLPVVLLAGVALVLLAYRQQAEIRSASIQTMRAMIGAVDAELLRSIAVLETLATTESLQQDDLARFHRAAQRTLSAQTGWTTIILSDPQGRPQVNAEHPFRAAGAGRQSDLAGLQPVLATRRPAVGPVVRDAAPGAYVFAVHVPVMRGDELHYVLTAAIQSQSIFEVIRRQRLPADGLVAIFDQRRNIVARSLAEDRFVGKPLAKEFRDLLDDRREGWGRTHSLEGEAIYTAYSLSGFSDWGVGIGIPRRAIDAPLLRSSLFFAAGILISLALGAAGAALVGRRIARPVGELRAAARALGRGEKPVPVVSTIPEVHEVAEALASAAEDRDRIEAAREETLRLEREARALAEDANRMKDQFLAMFGHELRNPLAAIKSAAELLSLPAASEEARRAAQAVLARQIDHLTHLVNDLLDVQRIMTGKIVLERRPVELAQALAHALAAMRATGSFAHHRLEVDARPVWIEGDATRIDQVLTNLLVNAARYTPPGRTIAVSVVREGREAVLRVRDEGVGIERQLLPRVFDLFVQGEGPLDRAHGGFGLGLTLVRRLVELHGGSVAAESAGAGKGSVFTVRLPARERPAADASGSRPAAPRRRRVLIVEDNDDARLMLHHALELAGHGVHEAVDGPSGVEAAIRLRPDVAFIDLGLPGLDGYEVARRIRAALGPHICLVALTGYGTDEDRRRSLEAGFDLHHVKPIDADRLQQVLAQTPDGRPPPAAATA